MKKITLLVCLLLFSLSSFAQNPVWVNTLGSSGGDAVNVTRTAPNGNVYVAGHFVGTMDLDPSTAASNISSHNNTQDMFLACYSSTGSFLWGFSIGKEDYDDIHAMDVDASSNVVIGGFFRGTNVDFDPSGGSALLTCLGSTGGSGGPYGGDGFVAKYSSTGAYQWVFRIGSSYWEDINSLAIDPSGNIYVGGQFKNVCDFDPSSGVANLNSTTNGTAFLAKYSSAGAYQWAFNLGKNGIPATDNIVDAIAIDGSGNVCIAGIFQAGQACDFDPSPTGTTMLTATGSYDAFVAKYTSSGNYVFAFNLHGSTWEQLTGIAVDASDNIYVTGGTDASGIDLDPSGSTAVASVTGASGSNAILAKYTSSGAYVWGKLMGGSGTDLGRELVYVNNRIYCVGQFGGTVDFNPGGTPSANLVSSGSDDVFWASYDLSGNYKCSFKIGSSTSDYAWSVDVDGNGNFYMAGQFSGSNVDFDPGSGTLLKTSGGNTDGFFTKYNVSTGSSTGYFSAATKKCGPTGDAYLTYTDSTIGNGIAVSITYSDGSSTYTKTVSNKMPFLLTPNATGTTTYTLSSMSATGCGGATGGNSITVPVLPLPVAVAGNDTSVCSGTSLQFTASGGKTYQWYPSTGLSNPTAASINPLITGNITYNLIAIDSNNCRDTDQVVISAAPTPVANAGSDTSICEDVTIQLAGSGGSSYLWYPSNGLSNITIPNPDLTVKGITVYNLVATNSSGCSDTDDVRITGLPYPTANAGNNVMGCLGDTVTLTGSGGDSYQWVGTNIPILMPNAATTKTVVTMSGKAFLIATNVHGCRDTDDVDVTLHVPVFHVPGSWDVCAGDSFQLAASGGIFYFWYPNTGLSASNIGNPIIKPTADVTYYLSISDGVCKTADTFRIDVHVREKPALDVTKSGDVDCSNGSVTLDVTGANSYVWSPASTLNTNIGNSVVASPKTTTEYTVVGSNVYGCNDSAKVTVGFKDIEESGLIIPHAFTPNGDGKNECFRTHVKVPHSSFEFAIYDRLGNRTFLANDQKMCWDGTYGGLPGQLGTYYYYLRIKTEACGEVFRKGDVHLIR